MSLTIIAAVAKNGVIGRNGKLPWDRIPEDMRHFRKMTEGHAIIMGRVTWESLGKPLPKRRNIVVTRTQFLEGAEAFYSLAYAIQSALTRDMEPIVIGGGKLYEAAIPLATKMIITEVNREAVEGDVRFPDFDRLQWRETERRIGEDPTLQFVTLERIANS